MKIRRFYGKDMRDALTQVKAELGGDAVIMSNKKVGDGIEIVAAYDREPPVKAPIQKPAINPQAAAPQPQAKPQGRTPSLSEIIGDSGPDSLRALLEKQMGHEKAPAPIKAPRPAQVSVAADKMPEENFNEWDAFSEEKNMSDIRQELKSLRNVLEFQVSGLMREQRKQTRPLHDFLVDRLERMGISANLSEQLVSFAPPNAEERDAWIFLMKLLANRLHTTHNDILRQGGVVALVGPTGTGKTTTIAKLAAQYAQRHGHQQVALITTDSYRIAAYEQLATYGKIIGCTVRKACNAEELSELLHQFRSKGLVLIDTAGFGQRDTRLIKQLDTLSQSSYTSIRHYLVLAANAQRQVMEHQVQAYGQISLQGCIFTKLDECYSLGEAISVAIEHKLPVSYLTEGQKVPEDIKAAEAKYIITCAARLFKQYALMPHKTKQVVNSAVSI
ncbi:flagellar biosynthesis protein FlhF [Aliiglaciecola sp. CAU 1673]|uniref:flagellar biosynthesis protein FlhF n=1 Tax=Aliiglaciecola sp. CAU 1673 TaxID=3032595 RepID=UPI0023DBFA8B|nr:flagellar biosynthesis protein FlhF [Aliiglaciecola sp. CAU 1673]MDF2177470.1 flagellar biosynthesis protein FlhF [Aliiglaciecola sp. CAU 1673]